MYKVRKKFLQNGEWHMPGETYTNLSAHSRPDSMIHGGYLTWEEPESEATPAPVIEPEPEPVSEDLDPITEESIPDEESALDQVLKPLPKKRGRPPKAKVEVDDSTL